MAESVTTSGNIYNDVSDPIAALAAAKDTQYELATRIHANADVIKDRQVDDFIATETNAQKRTDALNLANTNAFQASTAQAERIAQTETLAATLATQNITAQANDIASTETLAASLAFQNLTAQANDVGRNATNLATTNASAAAAQADRVAQSLFAQNERVAAASVIASTLQSKSASDEANRIAQNQRDEGFWHRDENRRANEASVLAGYVTRDLIRTEADETRKLINAQYTDGLRDKLNLQHQELVELRFDCKSRDRDYQQLNQNFLQSQMTSQINALGSAIQQVHQAATQKNVSFGSGTVTGGASTNNLA